MSPVEFSKRPMSAVANYPFHTPINIGIIIYIDMHTCIHKLVQPLGPYNAYPPLLDSEKKR